MQAEQKTQNNVTGKSDKADATHGRILDAAARLFREKGYAAVSLREIAAKAGMQAGSLYYHFDSKEAIVTEILDAGIMVVREEVQAAMLSLPKNASGADIIRMGILTHLRSLFEFNNYTSANVRIYSQVPPQVRKANLKVRRGYEALWESILSGVQAQGAIRQDVDIKSFRLLLISSMNATLDWFDPKRGNLNEFANSYADIMLHGLLSQRAPT